MVFISASASNGALASLLKKLLRFDDEQLHGSLLLPHALQVEVEEILVCLHRLGPNRQEEAGRACLTVKPEARVASVWQDFHTKVEQYRASPNLSQFNVSFRHFLGPQHRLIMMGREHSGTSSPARHDPDMSKGDLCPPHSSLSPTLHFLLERSAVGSSGRQGSRTTAARTREGVGSVNSVAS